MAGSAETCCQACIPSCWRAPVPCGCSPRMQAWLWAHDYRRTAPSSLCIGHDLPGPKPSTTQTNDYVAGDAAGDREHCHHDRTSEINPEAHMAQ